MTLNEQAPAAVAADQTESKDGHWYGFTAERGWYPLHGEGKKFGLADARKVVEAGGVANPSVTGYHGVLYKRPIEDYNMDGAILASKEIPEGDFETQTLWLKACRNHARSRSRGAMDTGSRIHRALEDAVMGKDYDASVDIYVQPVMKEREKLALRSPNPEKCVGSLKYGYGGTCDDHCEGLFVIDYKSRKAKGNKVPCYPTDKMQIAAYGFAIFGNEFFKSGTGVMIGISTDKPGLVTTHVFPGKELVTAFEAFLGVMQFWRLDNNFDPRRT